MAALITALTGLVIGLNTVGSSGDDTKPTPAAPSARRAVTADVIAGTWSGRARRGRREVFDVQLNINRGCTVKQMCGSISVSKPGCFGDFSLKGVSGERYEFSVDHFSTSSAEVCSPGAGEYLTPHGDDALLYTTGYDRSIRGTLHPPR